MLMASPTYGSTAAHGYRISVVLGSYQYSNHSTISFHLKIMDDLLLKLTFHLQVLMLMLWTPTGTHHFIWPLVEKLKITVRYLKFARQMEFPFK